MSGQFRGWVRVQASVVAVGRLLIPIRTCVLILIVGLMTLIRPADRRLVSRRAVSRIWTFVLIVVLFLAFVLFLILVLIIVLLAIWSILLILVLTVFLFIVPLPVVAILVLDSLSIVDPIDRLETGRRPDLERQKDVDPLVVTMRPVFR